MSKLSVLISLYSGTKSEELTECLQSLLSQTLPATEIVVLLDGPVTKEVEKTLNDFDINLPLKIVKYSVNRGLGPALNDGIHECKEQLIARVDSDDVSLPHRFELQVKYMDDNPQIAVLGGALRETYKHNNITTHVVRRMPEDWLSIQRYSTFRNPLNHQTVIMRKNVIKDAGGYKNYPWFEDYHLWARVIMRGHIIANLPDILVDAIADSDYFFRRGGWTYIKREFTLMKAFRKMGFHTLLQSIVFFLTRFPVRLMPLQIRGRIYGVLLRR